MVAATQLQRFLRHNAHLQYPALSVPPFTLFLHPSDRGPDANMALPDAPVGPAAGAGLEVLIAAFRSRGRQPRVEYVEAFAPELASLLRGAGFVERSRMPILACALSTYRDPPAVPGLEIAILTDRSPVAEVRAAYWVNAHGFEPGTAVEPDEAVIARFRSDLAVARAALAWLNGSPVASALCLPSYEGLAELVGIVTLPPYRRRGIGAALTAAATKFAFGEGIDAVFLCAADARAGRVYARIGFMPVGWLLAYMHGD